MKRIIKNTAVMLVLGAALLINTKNVSALEYADSDTDTAGTKISLTLGNLNTTETKTEGTTWTYTYNIPTDKFISKILVNNKEIYAPEQLDKKTIDSNVASNTNTTYNNSGASFNVNYQTRVLTIKYSKDTDITLNAHVTSIPNVKKTKFIKQKNKKKYYVVKKWYFPRSKKVEVRDPGIGVEAWEINAYKLPKNKLKKTQYQYVLKGKNLKIKPKQYVTWKKQSGAKYMLQRSHGDVYGLYTYNPTKWETISESKKNNYYFDLYNTAPGDYATLRVVAYKIADGVKICSNPSKTLEMPLGTGSKDVKYGVKGNTVSIYEIDKQCSEEAHRWRDEDEFTILNKLGVAAGRKKQLWSEHMYREYVYRINHIENAAYPHDVTYLPKSEQYWLSEDGKSNNYLPTTDSEITGTVDIGGRNTVYCLSVPTKKALDRTKIYNEWNDYEDAFGCYCRQRILYNNSDSHWAAMTVLRSNELPPQRFAACTSRRGINLTGWSSWSLCNLCKDSNYYDGIYTDDRYSEEWIDFVKSGGAGIY